MGRTEIQKFEYLENKKSFLDEIKSTFHSFWRAIIWWKKKLMKIADTSFNQKVSFLHTCHFWLGWPCCQLRNDRSDKYSGESDWALNRQSLGGEIVDQKKVHTSRRIITINHFHVTVLFLYPLKTIFWGFQEVKKTDLWFKIG